MPPRPSQASRSTRGGAAPQAFIPTHVPSHVTTVGVRRPGVGIHGRKIKVTTNHFEAAISTSIIHHYDVINADAKVLPPRLNMEIINCLQTVVAPHIFNPRVVYDGKKNIFAPQQLAFPGGTAEFEVNLGPAAPTTGRAPKPHKVRLTKVAEINPVVLKRFLQGIQSHENVVLTAITALNVVVRMDPSRHPFNARSFFTNRETKDIGGGIVLWRGYFQSVRPAVDRMLINLDISTGTMYKHGPLMDIALEHLGLAQPSALYAGNLNSRDLLRLKRFLSGVRVKTAAGNNDARAARVIRNVVGTGAATTNFMLREGGTMTIANYFLQQYNRSLRHPNAICVEVGSGAIIPIELCQIIEGQIMKKTVPPEKTKDVLEFATKKPADRLKSIVNGLRELNYRQSEYVNHFGMSVTEQPLQIPARVLPPPTLKYGPGSRQPTIVPRDGSWNMVDKKFIKPANIKAWMIIIYESDRRFGEKAVADLIQGLRKSCGDTGMKGFEAEPLVRWESGQGNVIDQIKAAGMLLRQQKNLTPDLVVVVLPEGAMDIYTAVKHFGDCITGAATQCLKAIKVRGAKPQYFANVCLKMNVKLGGINAIADQQSVPFLSDQGNPTLVLGADVIHPAPGAEGRPSFTCLVGSVDKDTSKYIATTRVQTSRQEIIEDFFEMAKHIITMYSKYRANVEKLTSNLFPRRIIFYRDGVSEGQFRAVLDKELQDLRKACATLGINPLPKITLVVVGKRHHVRFFPISEADKSGNCISGTVIDSDIVHPMEFDFYLQSHGGLLGTSRPAHYNCLWDDNRFTPDALQQLSYALCHLYARSTRAVSIPAPVYYADIVCSRARNHYDPQAKGLSFSDDNTQQASGKPEDQLDKFKTSFKPLHSAAAMSMYFM